MLNFSFKPKNKPISIKEKAKLFNHIFFKNIRYQTYLEFFKKCNFVRKKLFKHQILKILNNKTKYKRLSFFLDYLIA